MNKPELLACIRAFRQQVISELDRFEDALLSLKDAPDQVAPKQVKQDDWLTAQEVCECLKIGPSTLYRNIKAGLLPGGVEFSPRAIRWKMSDIVAYQKRRCAEERSGSPAKKRGRPSRIRKVEGVCYV